MYDELGRQKELKQGSTVRASWAYDSVAKGLPASSTRYVDGKAYTTKIDAYNDRGQPTSSTTHRAGRRQRPAPTPGRSATTSTTASRNG